MLDLHLVIIKYDNRVKLVDKQKQMRQNQTNTDKTLMKTLKFLKKHTQQFKRIAENQKRTKTQFQHSSYSNQAGFFKIIFFSSLMCVGHLNAFSKWFRSTNKNQKQSIKFLNQCHLKKLIFFPLKR